MCGKLATGAPGDLPERHGLRQTTHACFRRWRREGLLDGLRFRMNTEGRGIDQALLRGVQPDATQVDLRPVGRDVPHGRHPLDIPDHAGGDGAQKESGWVAGACAAQCVGLCGADVGSREGLTGKTYRTPTELPMKGVGGGAQERTRIERPVHHWQTTVFLPVIHL